MGDVQVSRGGMARWALALWALLAGIYLLTTGGHTYASDEEAMFAMAENLWYHGNFAVDQGPPLRYSQYNPGQPAAALPLYALGRLLLPLFPSSAENWLLRAFFSWFNPCVTAGIAVALFYAVCRLGYSQRAALGTALLYGLGTLAWPHSKTFFAEPFTALPLVAGFALISGAERNRRPFVSYSLAGVLCGAAMLVKIHGALLLPFLGLYALLAGIERRGIGRLAPAFLWSCGVAVSLGALALVQWLAFGNPLRTGYGGGTGEFLGNNSLSPGLYGLTLSPGKGLIWYAPVLLLLPIAIFSFWRDHWRAALVCALIVMTNVLFYAQIFVWHGDGAWGPRYLNIMLPFAVSPLAAFVARIGARTTPLRSAALALVILLCVPVQIGALSIHFNTYIGAQRDADKRYFVPRYSPIVQHLLMAGRQLGQLYAIDIAPNRFIIKDGWSYSEGNREQGEQFPRWTSADATLHARSFGGPVVVALTLDGCRPAPTQSAHVVVRAGTTTLVDAVPCPSQVYRVLLPPSVSDLTISSDSWDPRSVGIDRDGPLGVRVARVAAQSNGSDLPLAGRLVPIAPMPSGFVSLRNWFGDPRYNQWDFWWWYMIQSGLPARPLLLFGALWFAIAASLIAYGSLTLTRLLRVGRSGSRRAYQASGIKNQTSIIRHQAPGVRHHSKES